MTIRTLWLTIGYTVAILLLLPALITAATAQALGPTQQLKQTMDQALAVVEDPAMDDGAKMERLRRIIAPRLDFAEMSKRALGLHWPRDRNLQGEFVPLFQKLLERTYVKKIWLKEGRGIGIVYRNERIEGGSALVETALLTAKGSEIPVGYRLHLVGGEWKVYDFLIEGVSLVNNYRSQFRKILSQRSFGELLAHMRKGAEETK